jgi:hypothetical protein
MFGAIGFGAAAWKVAARDRWIGWDAPCRETRLHRVLNNARFLILPWVQVKNLASKVLALAATRIPEDFAVRYRSLSRKVSQKSGCFLRDRGLRF